MRSRMCLVSLLALCFAFFAASPGFAQTPSDAELQALNDRVLALQQAGQYTDAIPLAEQYAAGTKTHFGESATEYAAALGNLALILQAANRLAEAESATRHALEIDEKSLGPDNPNVAIRLNILAALLQVMNRGTEAEPLIRRALQIGEKSFGPDHQLVAVTLNNLAQLLYSTDRRAEAEPLMRRALQINEKNFGPDDPNVAASLAILAGLLQATNRLEEAEPLMRRALQITEKNHGPDHPDVVARLNNLAGLLQATNRLEEAEPLMRRALQIAEKSHGPNHPQVANSLSNLAGLLQETNRFAEAEPLMRRALQISEDSYGPDHPNVATNLSNLAGLLLLTDRVVEAEPLIRRALEIDEKSFGPYHPNVAIRLSSLALVLQATNRPAEAEPLMRWALKIDEDSYGSDHTNVAARLTGLALFLQAANKLAEAEPLMRRALQIYEKSFGPDHPNVASSLTILAGLLQATNRFDEAEPLMRRSLTILETSYGPDHFSVAITLNNLAQLLQATNRLAEAEPMMRRVIAVLAKVLGNDHPTVATSLINLAALKEEQGDWTATIALYARAKPIMIGARRASGAERGASNGKAILAQNSGNLRGYARALYRVDAANVAGRAEAFELAQWALQNEAADALSSMALRFAKGESRLAAVVREEQDLRAARETAYRYLDQAAGKSDTGAADAARAAIADIDAKLDRTEAALRRDFKDYAELTRPKPLAMAEAQALLDQRQALVVFLDLSQYGKVPEETLVFAVTKEDARWFSIPIGTRALWQRVTALRCGLDSGNWRRREKSREICKGLLGVEVSDEAVPPFDAGAAYVLYRDLFGQFEDMIRNKSLLIVPSGALTQLPFEVLVTAKPDRALPRFEAYKKAAWLGQRQAITMLPSVVSLTALRSAEASSATEPFIGFGNPLLTGIDGKDRSAWEKQSCLSGAGPKPIHVVRIAAPVAPIFRGGPVDLEELRRQPPLPEAADELCEIARAVGVAGPTLDKAVYLGERASVSRVKTLSQTGDLARAKVVHFATHGLIAGETALFAKNRAEPALLLTPPAAGTASEEDNGLLTASEVAQLKLDADWVILSACNTAAGQSENAEALSGLARAFFYAGARSLLVSHWSVNSDAAVAITTGAVNAMKVEPKIGRAEALHRSISGLIARGKSWDHPSVWAPFVLVGNGEQ
jgi:CHAT domain-containing protein